MGVGGWNGGEKWLVSDAGTLAGNKGVIVIAKGCHKGVFKVGLEHEGGSC